MIRKDFEIMAPVGSHESLAAAIAAGADAISWTPPDIRELERAVMEKARRLAAEQGVS